MGDAVEENVPCKLDGSDNGLNSEENSETNGPVTHIEISLPNQIKDECENQEIPTECKEEVSVHSLETDKATPSKQIPETGTQTDLQLCDEKLDKPVKKQGIFFSTPNSTRKCQESLSNSSDATNFGLMSPLDAQVSKGKLNLKRKNIRLQPIEEIDEDSDIKVEKKFKFDKELDTAANTAVPSEASTSTTLPCYEAPAKSLLKMWQPSCLSRNASATGTSFIVLDECGETEIEDCPKLSQENESKVDDFEIACQSLTEELMKSSSNIETLEKYHSKVQLENQMDDEKFDEILKELTMNVDLDYNMMTESTTNALDRTCLEEKTMEESVCTSIPNSENKTNEDNNTTITEGSSHIPTEDEPCISSKIDIKPDHTDEKNKETGKNKSSEPKTANENRDSNDDEEILDIDEEDYLLEENINTKDKPYEFFEFVSSDPKENEDNYNPEWQKLGRLTSDEERYKAVRDRWRSLVPPDPNRNLTFRQWRVRNNKSPIKLAHLNNNHQLMDDNEKNQLCTAVFDNKITKMVQDSEDSRMNIYRQRNRDFEELGHAQDQEQMIATMRGFNYRDLAQLHAKHVNQCKAVKSQYDQELKRIHDITKEKIRILKEAKEEVLLFQKFYKGVGAIDDNKMYMTDIQVQELMETEDMLEQYKVFYE